MSNIQWTDVTDNPIVPEQGGWWCKKISPGCANCYAEKLNHNGFFKGNMLPYSGEAPKLRLKREVLASWARMRFSKKHFVCSMTDMFGDWVPVTWQIEIIQAMVNAPRQTFQILTKRPEIALQTINHYLNCNDLKVLPSNIWIGTSVENQVCANSRIPVLDKIPAQIKFLSVEPLLCEVNLGLDFPGYSINWVIVGGESGANSRLCQIEWIHSVIEQCEKSEVAVFVKQLGSKPFWGDEAIELDDSKGGDIEEFPSILQARYFPKNSANPALN